MEPPRGSKNKSGLATAAAAYPAVAAARSGSVYFIWYRSHERLSGPRWPPRLVPCGRAKKEISPYGRTGGYRLAALGQNRPWQYGPESVLPSEPVLLLYLVPRDLYAEALGIDRVPCFRIDRWSILAVSLGSKNESRGPVGPRGWFHSAGPTSDKVPLSIQVVRDWQI